MSDHGFRDPRFSEPRLKAPDCPLGVDPQLHSQWINPHPQTEAEADTNMRNYGYARFRQRWYFYVGVGLLVLVTCCELYVSYNRGIMPH